MKMALKASDDTMLSKDLSNVPLPALNDDGMDDWVLYKSCSSWFKRLSNAPLPALNRSEKGFQALHKSCV